MKKLIPLVGLLIALSSSAQTGFSPTIKFKGLVHVRYEQSLTDSVDVQGKFNANPLTDNFRIRRLELRADVALNDQWSGVIRVQLPDLKTTTPGKAIELAYFQYKCVDQFQIRGGQFKTPMELDELTSHEDLRMIDRGTTDKIFVSNNLISYQPGLMVFGTFAKDKMPFSYYVGVFNGSDRSVAYDDNSQKNFCGRLEFTPIKGIRIGANAQSIGIKKDVMGMAAGGDLSIQQNITDKVHVIVEGEYIMGTNTSSYNASTDSIKDVNDFKMAGYFGQALFRFDLNSKCCKTFEVGGKYENTDPITSVDDNAYSTITGGIGFIFLPDNDARLQLNVVQTNYQKEIPGALLNNLMFVAQLQLKI